MANSRVIRELLVRLGVRVTPTTKADVDAMNKALERVKSTMNDTVRGALAVGRGLAIMAVGAAAAVGKLTTDMGGQAVEIERQARLLGLSRQEYQQWLYVAEGAGASAGDLADVFLQLNSAAQDTIGGGKEMGEAFRVLGIRANQLKGLDPGQIFDLMAAGVERATNKTAALAVVSRILGEEGSRQFGPTMLAGADAAKAMRDEAAKLGVVMSDDLLASLARVGTQTRKLKGLLKGLRNVLAAALAPIVERVVKRMADWVDANRAAIASGIERWVERLRIAFENLNRAVTAIGGWDVVLLGVAQGAGLLTLLANLGRIQALLSSLKILWAVMLTGATAFASAVGIGLLPLTLIVLGLVTAIGLLALGIEDLWIWWQGGNSLLGQNLDLIESFIPAFGGLRDLVWALVEGFGAFWRNIDRITSALANGLAPALKLIHILIEPLLPLLEKLEKLWLSLNADVGSRLTALAVRVRGITDANELTVGGGAALVQGQLAGAVQGQVDRIDQRVQSFDNSVRNANINQVNNLGAGGARDAVDTLNSALRRAVPALQGGRR